MTKKNDLKCDAVLFDMDGTILDTIPLITESFQYTFMKHLGYSLDEAEIRAGIGIPLERVFTQYSSEQAAIMMKTYTTHNIKHFDTHIGMFIGVYELIKKLRKLEIKVGVVTSKLLSSALGSMRQFDIIDMFDLIQGKESTLRHKPEAEPLLHAMAELNLTDPSRVVYVGDSIHDLLSAKAAGCISAVVGWTQMPKDELKANKPDLWINQADDLYRWVVDA